MRNVLIVPLTGETVVAPGSPTCSPVHGSPPQPQLPTGGLVRSLPRVTAPAGAERARRSAAAARSRSASKARRRLEFGEMLTATIWPPFGRWSEAREYRGAAL